MAQVRKFYTGGGMLKLNGKEYTADQINEYINQAELSSQERAALSGTINAIASGQTRSLDRNANSLSGEGVTSDFTGFYGNEKRAERNTSGKGIGWSNRQARRNSDHHIANTAISKLGGIEDYFSKKDADAAAKAKEENILYKLSDSDGFYTTGDDGKLTFIEGPDNLNNKDRITRILNVLQNGGIDGYNLTQWGGDNTLNGLVGWYGQADNNIRSQYTSEALWDRIKNQKLTDLDKEILTKMGMSFAPATHTHTDINGTSAMHQDWTGDRMAAKQAGVYFTKDSNGRWVINSNNTSNQYLNSDWYAGGLDFLAGTDYENGFIGADGKLYTQAEILDGSIYRSDAINKFLSGNSDQYSYKDWYDRVNGSVRFRGDRTDLGIGEGEYGLTSYNPYTSWNSDWYTYFKGLGDGDEEYFLNDISANYDGLNGKKIIAYVDPSGAKNAIGIKNLKYAVRDANGNITTYDSEDALRNAGYAAKNQWWTPAPSIFNNSLWDVNVNDNTYAKAHTIVTAGNQENTILVDRNGNYYLGIKKQGSDEWESPRLIQNMPLFDSVLANPSRHNNAQLEQLYKNVPRPVIQSATNETITPQNQQEVIDQKIPKQKQPRFMWIDDNGVICTKGMFGSKQYWNEGTGEWSSKYPSMKTGGSIPKIKPLPTKFQYGGAVGKSKTESKNITSDGAKTDITSSHNVRGTDDGGLTNAEKLQIAAAVGDLVGVGASFVPVYGNIAGAVTGLGSTATRLVADIKKDGFQAKDIWNFAGGALLDLATVIPGLGTGAKTAKVVKAIKAAATPIMKVLSLAGAAAGVAAMGKVIRGEDVTSEDLTAIISGIGSAAIAGKQLKDTIGDAKLAKKLATSAAKSANKANADEVLGKTLQKTRQEIATLLGDTKSEKEAVSKVQKLLQQTNPNATADDARKVLGEWGVETTRSRFSGKKDWLEYLQFWKKGEKQISFDVPKEQEAGSTLYYMLNPFARAKQIGYDIGFKSSKGNLGQLTRDDVAAAERMLNNGSHSSLAQAIARRTVDNPSAFSFELNKRATRMNRWGFPVYMRKLKTVPQPQPSQPQTLMLPAPQQVLMLPAPAPTPSPTQPIKLLPPPGLNPRVKAQLDPFEQMGFYAIEHPSYAMRERIPLMPGESGYFVPTNRVSDGWIMRNYDPMFEFKDGGKIEYAKHGRILKGQDSLVVPEIQDVIDPATGKLISELTPEELAAYKKTIFPKTDEERAEYKRAMEEARASGQDFIYKGVNFGKIKESTPLPEGNTALINARAAYDQANAAYNAAIAEGSGKTPEEIAALKSNLDSARTLLGEESKKVILPESISESIPKWDAKSGLSSMGISAEGPLELSDTDWNAFADAHNSRFKTSYTGAQMKNFYANPSSVEIPEFVEVTEEAITDEPDIWQTRLDWAKRDAEKMALEKGWGARKTRKAIEGAQSTILDERASLQPEAIGSAVGEGKPLDWGKIEGIGLKAGRVAGELASTISGINQQLGYAEKNRNLAKSAHTVNVPEYYESFNDSGKRAAYEQGATEAENQASLNLTSDPYLNRLFKRQAAAEARKLRLEGRLAQSEEYSKFKQNNLARRAAYAEQRVANLNKDILRHLNADASYNLEASKAVALKTDAWKNAASDAINIYNQQKLSGISSEYTDLSRRYQDWYTGEKAKYDASNTIDKTKYSTFDSYLAGDKTLTKQYRDWQDQMAGLQKRAALYQKKGGNIRPTAEQIRIDTQKAKHKAIDKLSKQSFELLKKALS